MKKRFASLKHGAYSGMTILPGESVAEFEHLHQQLICELNPNGILETETVGALAHLLWRRKNLSTFRSAEIARKRMREVREAVILTIGEPKSDEPEERRITERWHAAKAAACKELGVLYDLVEMGEAATIEGLTRELEVQDRLDGMIERCLKRLLMARGLKSMPTPRESPPHRYLECDEK